MKIHTRPILKTFIITFLVIMVLNLIAIVLYFKGNFQEGIGYQIFKNLYVDREENLPTFFNTILFLVNSVLLFYIHYFTKQAGDKAVDFGYYYL